MAAPDSPVAPADLPIGATYAGKRILLTGTTGFLGKVVLSYLLTRFPDIGHIYVLIRPGPSDRAKDRFAKKVMASPAMGPVVQAHPHDLEKFLTDKVTPVDGNITKENCGLSAEALAEIKGLDLILNSAGLVDFDPSVESALSINAVGAQNVVKLAKDVGAALVHVSTCFVAGKRSGQILEDEPILGRLPDATDQRASDFDFQREITRLGELAQEVRNRADDPATKAQWRKEAIDKLAEEGRDASDGVALKAAVLRQKKVWLTQELKRVGMERAKFWGWTNTYTFTKALGEMVIADAAQNHGLTASIVRPSIVESAHSFPLPGWNEGFTTTAPLILMVRQGLLHFPFAEDLLLDVIPCDMVATAIIAAGAACLTKTNKMVYQAASGDVNPLTIKKALELTAYEGKTRARAKVTKLRASRPGPALIDWFKRHYETQPIPLTTFNKISTPRLKTAASSLIKTIDDIGPDRVGWMREPLSKTREIAEFVETSSSRINMVLDLFIPFVAENKYVFRCDNTRALMQRVPQAERDALNWSPEGYLWRDYFIKTHIPGLEKWVFPALEEELAEKPKLAHMHRDLVDMFESTTHAHRHRLALRFLDGDTFEHLTYGDLRQLAERVSAFVLDRTKGEVDQRILLVSENRPEWVAAYFGILRAGCTVVPVDAAAKANEIVNIAKAAKAAGVIVSPKVQARLGNVDAPLWSLRDAVRFRGELVVPKAPARLASLIFTSGTTGTPKGVMLSHRNFTFEVSRLAGIFTLGDKDHLLSVLPLHHTFEFTAGLLLPLSRGATITYLSELNGDTLQRALSRGVTGLIGVPALWQLLQRRIESRINEKTALAGLVLDGVRAVNSFLRDRTEFNLGPLLAYPVHRALGGRLRYLVSGGSALSPEVLEFFRGIGFNMTEGYGLTETAPVLTVTDPLDRVITGSVGKPLHGVDIKIDEPNEDGIGEVLARGPNVMLGYWGEDAPPALTDGWFHTGDLGHVDGEGRLFLVGRKKDVIVDADGRNVYPDELEELYGKHDAIKELSIVGVTSEGRERVACLIVPAYGDRPRDEVRREIQEHVKRTSDTLPYHKRLKVVHVVDHDLPRTSTRKVKRPEVVAELMRLSQATAHVHEAANNESTPVMLARQVVAGLLSRTVNEVAADARLIDLGFDSLMFVELATALEAHVKRDVTSEALMAIERVADLARLLVATPAAMKPKAVVKKDEQSSDPEALTLPAPIAKAGKSLLRWGQKKFYERVMDVEIHGRDYVPRDTGFIVAANHASHLDAGLVELALGEHGDRLVSLAARDYFFGSRLKRTYFENFTNLLPIERHGATRASLRRALAVIERGDSLLIFPEGTRSPDGALQPFKASIGYLAITSERPVVPMYLWGTFEAMPKGSTLLPRSREIGALIGPALRPELMKELTSRCARSEAHRMATLLVERAVQALRDQGGYRPELLARDIADEALPAKTARVEGDEEEAPRTRRESVKGRSSSRTMLSARGEHDGD
ncbi:MAG: AMP-binding protein [Myxococcota bacterium]